MREKSNPVWIVLVAIGFLFAGVVFQSVPTALCGIGWAVLVVATVLEQRDA